MNQEQQIGTKFYVYFVGKLNDKIYAKPIYDYLEVKRIGLVRFIGDKCIVNRDHKIHGKPSNRFDPYGGQAGVRDFPEFIDGINDIEFDLKNGEVFTVWLFESKPVVNSSLNYNSPAFPVYPTHKNQNK